MGDHWLRWATASATESRPERITWGTLPTVTKTTSVPGATQEEQEVDSTSGEEHMTFVEASKGVEQFD